MRKSTMLRFFGLALLAATALFGGLTFTAEPLQAKACLTSLLGCPYEEVRPFGTTQCCVYQCADGRELVANCDPLYP
jgi:uncharacterized protein YjeT (DUF2065 family)